MIIDKATLFKYPTTPKLVPTRDTIISDIKSETEFENCIIGTTPDPNLEAIHFCTDNPTINSSIVRYDSNFSHKPRGTSKPSFPLQRIICPQSHQSAK